MSKRRPNYPQRSTLSAVSVAPWLGGITEPWCAECSWAELNGVMTIKYISRACPVHGRVLKEYRPVQGR